MERKGHDGHQMSTVDLTAQGYKDMYYEIGYGLSNDTRMSPATSTFPLRWGQKREKTAKDRFQMINSAAMLFHSTTSKGKVVGVNV